MPDRAQILALEDFNAYLCRVRQLGEVAASGATTLGDLDALLPKLGYAQSSDLGPETPIYGAVVRGDCVAGDEDAYRVVQGYLLFDEQGRLLYGRVWREGLEPELTAPFGPATDDGLADVSHAASS